MRLDCKSVWASRTHPARKTSNPRKDSQGKSDELTNGGLVNDENGFSHDSKMSH